MQTEKVVEFIKFSCDYENMAVLVRYFEKWGNCYSSQYTYPRPERYSPLRTTAECHTCCI